VSAYTDPRAKKNRQKHNKTLMLSMLQVIFLNPMTVKIVENEYLFKELSYRERLLKVASQ